MAETQGEFVALLRTANPVQRSLVGEVLSEAGIRFLEYEDVGPGGGFLSLPTLQHVEFRVPPAELQRAKDVLCANGVVCDISERLLRRTLDEVMKPLLASEGRDLTRLLYLVKVNNKETVGAIYEETRKLVGGTELLADLFFEMARAGEGNLRILARALAEEPEAELGDRFARAIAEEGNEARCELLGAAAVFGKRPWVLRSVAAALLAPDPEVREAASEALFEIEGVDYGYDPEAPEAERESSVARFLRASGLA